MNTDNESKGKIIILLEELLKNNKYSDDFSLIKILKSNIHKKKTKFG